MQRRIRFGVAAEIIGRAARKPQVGRVEGSGTDRRQQLVLFLRRIELADADQGAQQHQPRRGQQAPDPAGVERPEIEAAAGFELPQQQAADQVA
jgi:hypothetical protein